MLAPSVRFCEMLQLQTRQNMLALLPANLGSVHICTVHIRVEQVGYLIDLLGINDLMCFHR